MPCFFLLLFFILPLAAQDVTGSDSAAPPADSIAPYDFSALSPRIGFYGLGLTLTFYQQLESRETALPKARTLGAGMSGDVLTGLSFVHLIPALQYFQYSEKRATGYVVKIVHRDLNLSFYTALVTPRFTYRKARLFAGAGPSLHLSMLSYVDADDQVNLFPSLKSGLGGMAGLELPLSANVSYLFTASYRQEFDWDGPYRRYFSLSAGVAL